MNDDLDWPSGEASRGDASRAPAEARERVIRQVCERLAAEAAGWEAPRPRDSGVLRKSVPTQVGATLRSPPVGLAVAGEEERGAVPVAANDVAEPCPPAEPAPPVPAFLASTVVSPDLPAEEWAKQGALPFGPPPPELPGPPPKRAPKTVQSRVHRFAMTAPVDDDAVARALRAVLPFLASPPPLTLEQYASLCVELAFWPEQSAAILRRYHVPSDAVREALHAHWGGQLAARPELRARFEENRATYAAWLRAQAR